jgi:drug/metabolite transporter (DMT)-like permease
VARVPITQIGPSAAEDRAVRTQGQKSQREKSTATSCLWELIVPLTAFLLVVVAALAHATWNFLAKRAAHSKNLIWFSSATEAVLFAPVVIWVLTRVWSSLGLKAAIFLLATGILHLLYTESLLRGYRAGDLTVVYPLARGTGPLLSFVGAVLLLHERPSLLAAAGALMITFGVLLSSGGLFAFRDPTNRTGLFWGVATGCTIACYTVVDGYSVKMLLLSPFLVDYAGNLFRTIVLAVGAYRRRVSLRISCYAAPDRTACAAFIKESRMEFDNATNLDRKSGLRTEYLQCWREASAIGVLTPAGYILVLFAMRLAPISHVAPIREMSMLIGLFLGAKFLSEGDMVRRIIGSAFIAGGVAGLALG